MTKATLLKRASGMTSRLALVLLCAIALTGCAQFRDGFGELWGPQSLAGTAYGSDSLDSTRPNDRSDHGRIRKEEMRSRPTASEASRSVEYEWN